MSKTFLAILEDLKEVSNDKQKSDTSLALARSLEDAPQYSERLFQAFITRSLSREVGSSFQDIINGDFFSSRVKVYLDEDFTTKITIGLAFLQNEESYDSDLDMKVLMALEKEIQRVNLDLIVNDVSVNELQSRCGVIKNRVTEG